MPAHNAHGRTLSLDGTDFTSLLIDASVDLEIPEIDKTNQGSTNQEASGGLRGLTLNLEMIMDYTAVTGLHVVIMNAIDTNDGITTVIVQSQSTGGVTYTGDFLITSYQPIPSGTHTDLAKFSASWPAAGTIVES